MQKPSTLANAASKTWTSPRLDKLGTIADVAGAGSANTQTGGGSPPRS